MQSFDIHYEDLSERTPNRWRFCRPRSRQTRHDDFAASGLTRPAKIALSACLATVLLGLIILVSLLDFSGGSSSHASPHDAVHSGPTYGPTYGPTPVPQPPHSALPSIVPTAVPTALRVPPAPVPAPTLLPTPITPRPTLRPSTRPPTSSLPPTPAPTAAPTARVVTPSRPPTPQPTPRCPEVLDLSELPADWCSKLGAWSICRTGDGTIDGSGYGCSFHPGDTRGSCPGDDCPFTSSLGDV